MEKQRRIRARRSFTATDEEYVELKELLRETRKLTGKKAAESMIVALKMYNAAVKKAIEGVIDNGES